MPGIVPSEFYRTLPTSYAGSSASPSVYPDWMQGYAGGAPPEYNWPGTVHPPTEMGYYFPPDLRQPEGYYPDAPYVPSTSARPYTLEPLAGREPTPKMPWAKFSPLDIVRPILAYLSYATQRRLAKKQAEKASKAVLKTIGESASARGVGYGPGIAGAEAEALGAIQEKRMDIMAEARNRMMPEMITSALMPFARAEEMKTQKLQFEEKLQLVKEAQGTQQKLLNEYEYIHGTKADGTPNIVNESVKRDLAANLDRKVEMYQKFLTKFGLSQELAETQAAEAMKRVQVQETGKGERLEKTLTSKEKTAERKLKYDAEEREFKRNMQSTNSDQHMIDFVGTKVEDYVKGDHDEDWMDDLRWLWISRDTIYARPGGADIYSKLLLQISQGAINSRVTSKEEIDAYYLKLQQK